MDDLSLLYVVGVAASAGNIDGKRHPLQLQSMRKDVTLRGPAWLLPAVDSQDVVPGPVHSSVKDANLAMVLGRLFDYVSAYERTTRRWSLKRNSRRRPGRIPSA